MTDKELIQLYKMCSEHELCEGCPEHNDVGLCPIDRYCDLDDLIPRLEALLAEVAEMDQQIQKEICKRVDVERESERLKEQIPQWVSVDERLPENSDEQVLVVVNGFYDGIHFHDAIEIAEFNYSEGWILESWPDWENPCVTFWQPLPEPPSTEGVE